MDPSRWKEYLAFCKDLFESPIKKSVKQERVVAIAKDVLLGQAQRPNTTQQNGAGEETSTRESQGPMAFQPSFAKVETPITLYSYIRHDGVGQFPNPYGQWLRKAAGLLGIDAHRLERAVHQLEDKLFHTRQGHPGI